ncbi:MAG: hypothetical protein PHT94_00770 [Candidatus Nanoarchaeia archaeon]|nr:hypothetical protein [Candidatus Nanoarchaeia archaeon]
MNKMNKMNKMAICDCKDAAYEVFASFWMDDKIKGKVVRIVAKYLSMRYGYTTVNQITAELMSIIYGFQMDDLNEFRQKEKILSSQVRNIMHSKKIRKEFFVNGAENETKQYVWSAMDLTKDLEEFNEDEIDEIDDVDEVDDCDDCDECTRYSNENDDFKNSNFLNKIYS